MKWFEPLLIIIAIFLVISPILTHFIKKKKGTLVCECGHLQTECTGNCSTCSSCKDNKLTYVLSIDGMRCGMCETHINDVIRKNFDVITVKSSRKDKKTIIEVNHFLNIQQLKDAISDVGYSIISIKLQ